MVGYSIEIVPEVANSAAKRLCEFGYRNITVRQGDGYAGWTERAPFDWIILTAALPVVQQALIDRLAVRGRLVAPAATNSTQELIVLDKRADRSTSRRSVSAVRFVPMQRSGK